MSRSCVVPCDQFQAGHVCVSMTRNVLRERLSDHGYQSHIEVDSEGVHAEETHGTQEGQDVSFGHTWKKNVYSMGNVFNLILAVPNTLPGKHNKILQYKTQGCQDVFFGYTWKKNVYGMGNRSMV